MLGFDILMLMYFLSSEFWVPALALVLGLWLFKHPGIIFFQTTMARQAFSGTKHQPAFEKFLRIRDYILGTFLVIYGLFYLSGKLLGL